MKSSTSSIRDILGRSSVHPFPARMAAGLAVKEIAKLEANGVVLDPMAGSGTVLAVARSLGCRAIGFDVDPLAVLISKVWTCTVDNAKTMTCAARVLSRARFIFETLSTRQAYPKNSDSETKRFIRYWFDPYARRQLAALAIVIGRLRSKKMRQIMWCALSRMIIAKQSGVSLALDLSHSRPHRAFELAPRKPFALFLDSVERVIAGCVPIETSNRGPASKVALGDARSLPLEEGSVDLVVTSPPYLNAIDYMRCSKFTLVWMGYSVEQIRAIRHSSIGAEVGAKTKVSADQILEKLKLGNRLSPRTKDVLRRYVIDIGSSIKEVSRVLKRGGKAIYVMGENTIQGTFIPTGNLIRLLAKEHDLQLRKKYYRELPENRRYLPAPTNGNKSLDGRMRREVVLTFSHN